MLIFSIPSHLSVANFHEEALETGQLQGCEYVITEKVADLKNVVGVGPNAELPDLIICHRSHIGALADMLSEMSHLQKVPVMLITNSRFNTGRYNKRVNFVGWLNEDQETSITAFSASVTGCLTLIGPRRNTPTTAATAATTAEPL